MTVPDPTFDNPIRVGRPLPIPIDYTVTTYRVIDGDTIRCHLWRLTTLDHHLEALIRTTEQLPIRLIHVDTPETRPDLNAWRQARLDTTAWLTLHNGHLRCETLGHDNFGRLLGDIYVETDRSNTLTQHLIRDRGWPPYTATRA